MSDYYSAERTEPEKYSQEGYDINDHSIVVQYFKDLSQIPLLSVEEETRLLRSYKSGNEYSRQKLIESNLRLVVAIAKRYIRSGVPLMDLIQDGNLGLIHALEKYDISHTNRFSTYAVWQIRHFIRRAIANKGRLIRIPVNLFEKRKRIDQITETILKFEGREPSIDEIAKQAKLSKKKVKEVLSYFQPLLSLEFNFKADADCFNGENEMEYLFKDSCKCDHPEIKVFANYLKEQLNRALGALTTRERNIFKLYYGLDDNKSCTLNVIGRKFKLTRERIRQIKNEATVKVKDFFMTNVMHE